MFFDILQKKEHLVSLSLLQFLAWSQNHLFLQQLIIQAELEKARAKQKKDFKFNFIKPRKDWSIYGGWVNAYEPVNKGRLGSTQEWKIEKLGRKYY